MIVTYNDVQREGLPREALATLGLRALRPDDFLMEVAAADPDGATAAARSLVAVKRCPPRTMEEEIEGLRANMLGRFAEFIEQTLGLGRQGCADRDDRGACL